MIYAPVYISCDSCGLEREPSPGIVRETLADAVAGARVDGWIEYENRARHLCPHCRVGSRDRKVRLGFREADLARAAAETVSVGDLVSSADVAGELGCSRQRLGVLLNDPQGWLAEARFPGSVAVVGGVRIWRRSDVLRWIDQNGDIASRMRSRA
jgi:predicted DNA-binding transcriptional regulator AlpA